MLYGLYVKPVYDFPVTVLSINQFRFRFHLLLGVFYWKIQYSYVDFYIVL